MSGRPAPAKPWERNAGTAGRTSTPLGPSTAADGQPKPWEQPAGSATLATPASTSALAASQPARPWERDGTFGATSPSTSNYTSGYGSSMYGSGTYGGVNSRPMYGRGYGSTGSGSTGYGSTGYGSTGYGSTGYGSSYGSGYGSTYGNSGYGSSYGSGYGSGYGGMGGYGGTGYGSGYGGSSGYGGYGSGYGGGYGGYGSQYGSPFGRPALGGPAGPYEPGQGPPPQPPSAWQHMLAGLSGIVGFFGRLSFLVDENAHAIHFFISALLQLLDRAGSLYGEMARFVLRVLGYKGKPAKGKQPADSGHLQQHPQQPGLLQSSANQAAGQRTLPGSTGTPWNPSASRQPPAPAAAAQGPAWDNVWKTSD